MGSANTKLPRPAPDVTTLMYRVDVASVRDAQLAATFTLSGRDNETNAFLRRAAREGRSFSLVQKARAGSDASTRAQRNGMSRTDATAMYFGHDMVVATSEQIRHLLTHAGISSLGTPTLLDIGAGRGEVTAALAKGLGVPASSVVAMEASAPLRKGLKAAGHRAIRRFNEIGEERFGAVALLNVLDRCDDPASLLAAATRRLLPGGLLLVATVLPFCDRVYEGVRGRVNAHRPPTNPLKLPHSYRCNESPPRSFEKHVARFVMTAFPSLPLRMLSWTRLPYLCMGDFVQTHYSLDNALFVLRHTPPEVTPPAHARRLGIFGPLFSTPRATASACARVSETRPALRWLGSVVRSQRPGGWGTVLDSGTGRGSLCWLLSQPTSTITAVTALQTNLAYGYDPLRVIADSAGSHRHVRLHLGNWQNASLLPPKAAYDVVLLDYLLAAVEMHWAHHADEVLWRVLRTVRPGGGLALLTGIEPYELTLSGRARTADQLVLDVEAIGDAAALLAQRSTYRELPLSWVLRQIERAGGFRVIATKTFPMGFDAESLRGQLTFAREEAAHVTDPALRHALNTAASRLQMKVAALGSREAGAHARNYAVVFERL